MHQFVHIGWLTYFSAAERFALPVLEQGRRDHPASVTLGDIYLAWDEMANLYGFINKKLQEGERDQNQTIGGVDEPACA